jgi:hypothetical protein
VATAGSPSRMSSRTIECVARRGYIHLTINLTINLTTNLTINLTIKLTINLTIV